MSSILDTLPPLNVGDRFKDVTAFRYLGRSGGSQLYECWDDAIRERDRIVVEHVVRMCAEVCNKLAREHIEASCSFVAEYRGHGAEECAEALLALLEPKP